MGTWEHRAILEGNKGTRTLPGRQPRAKRGHQSSRKEIACNEWEELTSYYSKERGEERGLSCLS